MTHWQRHWSQLGTPRPTDPEDSRPLRANEVKQNQADGSGTKPVKPHLLTSEEAAQFLRLSRRTLERYRVTGGGPNYVKLGPGKRARVVYREADLRAWLEGAVFNSTSEYGR